MIPSLRVLKCGRVVAEEPQSLDAWDCVRCEVGGIGANVTKEDNLDCARFCERLQSSEVDPQSSDAFVGLAYRTSRYRCQWTDGRLPLVHRRSGLRRRGRVLSSDYPATIAHATQHLQCGAFSICTGRGA